MDLQRRLSGSIAEGTKFDAITPRFLQGELVPQGAYTLSIQATFLNGEIWQGMDYGNGEVETAVSVMVVY